MHRVTEALCSATWLAGHSLPGDIDQLLLAGLPCRPGWVSGERCLDSLLLARMADENRMSYGLEDLACTLLSATPWKGASTALMVTPGNMASVPPEIRKERCRLDAWWAYKLVEALWPQFEASRPLVEFTHRVAWAIHRVCLAGAVVDLNEFDRMAGDITEQVADLLWEIHREVTAHGFTEIFTPTNDHHIRAYLYDILGLEPPRRTQSGLAAVDKSTLQSLKHPVADLLVEYSRWDKLRSTYVDSLRLCVSPAGDSGGARVGWLRWHINPLGTRTGRRTSENPNSQNWPESVRRIVRSRWPGGHIGDFDFRSLEPVILGWVAEDERFLHAFTKGKGYVDVAWWLFHKRVEEGTKEYKAAKAIVLGTNYGMGVAKLAGALGTGVDVATRLRRTYFEAFPGVRVYIADRRSELLNTGQVVSRTGRVRRLPVPDGEQTPGFKHLENAAVNFPIQSFAADVTGSAVVDVEAALLSQQNQTLTEHHRNLARIDKDLTNGHPLGTVGLMGYSVVENEVHDSLLVDVHPSNPERDTELVVETMQALPTLRQLVPSFTIPLRVKVQRGTSWGGQ